MYRCPACRTRRSDLGLFKKHLRNTGHKVCHCGGYKYAHRPGSLYCEHNPLSLLAMAQRYHSSDEELILCAYTLLDEFGDTIDGFRSKVEALLSTWNITLD